MKYLIDTHIFIWFVENSSNLSQSAKSLIENPNNQIYISIVSLWEISIKTSVGKLQIKGPYSSVIDDLSDNSISILPLEFAHTIENNIETRSIELSLLRRLSKILISSAPMLLSTII